MNAQTAEKWGLVNRVVAPSELLGAATGIAKAILKNQENLVLKYKAVINDGFKLPLGEALKLGQRYGEHLTEMPEKREKTAKEKAGRQPRRRQTEEMRRARSNDGERSRERQRRTQRKRRSCACGPTKMRERAGPRAGRGRAPPDVGSP